MVAWRDVIFRWQWTVTVRKAARRRESCETFLEATYSLLCSLSSSAARLPPALLLLMFHNCFSFAACGEIFHTALKVTVVRLPCESFGIEAFKWFFVCILTRPWSCAFSPVECKFDIRDNVASCYLRSLVVSGSPFVSLAKKTRWVASSSRE